MATLYFAALMPEREEIMIPNAICEITAIIATVNNRT